MAEAIEIDGGEDALCRALLARKIVPRELLERLIRERRAREAAGQPCAPLARELVEAGQLGAATLDALRAETQAFATCDACKAFHRVSFHQPGVAYACAKCSAPLRPRAVSSGGADESLAGTTLLGGDETMLDLNPMPPKPAEISPPSVSTPLLPVGDETTMLGMSALGPRRNPATEILKPQEPKPPEPPPAPAPLEPTIKMGSQTETAGTIIVPSSAPAALEPTLKAADVTPHTKNPLDATPRTGSGGARSFVPTKAAPKEVQEAAKDAQRVFGKYVLVKELGRGGAGVVYKAWDTLLAQYVALKFIRDQDMSDTGSGSGSSQAVADFQREARMSAKLRHPNIIRIYELGCMSDRYYLAMDYIEGGSLFEVIHDGKERNTDTVFPKDPRKYLGIMRKIAEAVHAAHSNNPPVIHRDLKPHNVLVDKAGVPYVVDFGLAKEVELSTSHHTMTGVVKGTPSYMAPEQAEGRNKEVDARTDIYSLGAILYEMLTGRPPFSGGSVREVLNAICNKLPDRPNEAVTASLIEKPDGPNRPRPVPKPLETICMKALEKASADRYQTAQEMADDLGRFLNDEDIMAQEPGLVRRVRRKLRQHPLLTGTGVAALLCAGVIYGALRLMPRADTSAVDQFVNAAEEHLKTNNWAALKTDAENLRRVDPKHPLIARLEKADADHAADLARRRAQWKAELAKLPAGELGAAIEALRPPFRAAGELQKEFGDQLQRSLLEIQDGAENEAREIIGAGPRVEWLDAKLKTAALASQTKIARLLALATDVDFPFKPAPGLANLKSGLDPVVGYEGLWDLRVNVAPYARVRIRRGAAVVAEEWTPLGVRGLEVADDYTLELLWPAADKPDQRHALPLKDLKHGASITVTGDMARAALRVER